MISELEPIARRLQESRAQLRASIAGLSDAQMQEPFPRGDWSIHDALAHLAANEALMTELARYIVEGGETPIPADFDNDRFNAESVAARKTKSIDDLRAELGQSRARLVQVLDGVTRDQLARRGTHPLQGDMTLREFLVVVLSHETTHAREIADQARQVRENG